MLIGPVDHEVEDHGYLAVPCSFLDQRVLVVRKGYRHRVLRVLLALPSAFVGLDGYLVLWHLRGHTLYLHVVRLVKTTLLD